MAEIKYKPLSFQREFHDSKAKKVYLSSGYGAGKTYSLVMKMFRMMDENRNMAGAILCPTLKMYRRDVLPTIWEICMDNDIHPSYNKSDMTWFFNETGSLVYIYHSEDDGASIRGPSLAWGLVNEITLCTEMAFKALLGRLRKKGATLQVGLSGTPEGFNWTYEYFIEKPRADTHLIFGNSRDNHYVSDEYIQLLEDSYDQLMQEQYIDGKFVNLTGKRVAYAFDRFKHTDSGIDRLGGYPVWVSIDFNVCPMSAVLWNRVPFQAQPHLRQRGFGHELRAFDEIRINSSNTYELSRVLKEKIPDWKESEITLYPDPAGASRSTKSQRVSDIDILRSEGFHDIKYKRSITVRSCVNALNNMLGKNRIIINRDRCPNLIADLEQCVFKEGAFEIDKSNAKRTHWLDGMKNMVEYEFPIKAGRGFRMERRL